MLHENDMSFMFKSRSVSRCRSFLIINEQLTREDLGRGNRQVLETLTDRLLWVLVTIIKMLA